MDHPSLNFMLDLETLATTDEDPNVAILSIGCVRFDPIAGEILDRFYQNVTLESNVEAGRRICPRTIEWWMQQSHEARLAFFTSERRNIETAMVRLNAFFNRDAHEDRAVPSMYKHGRLWSHGPTFDEAIIRHAYVTVLERDFPFSFRGSRCNRTVMEMLEALGLEPPERHGSSHNALADAEWQAECVIKVHQKLREVRG